MAFTALRAPKLGCVPHRSTSSRRAAFSGVHTAASRSLALKQSPQQHQRASLIAYASQPEEQHQQQFDVDAGATVQLEGVPQDLGPRDDDVLPDSLQNAVEEAARATSEAIMRGNPRTQVEIHMPEFWDPISGPQFPTRGDQERFWKITRRFLLTITEATGCKKVRAVYPDAGVAAMLTYQWREDNVPFILSSLNDRRPVQVDDELIVICCPDPPGADDCMRLVRMVGEQDEKEGREYRPVVMFNQRLSSGDVGLGLNARRLRESFLRNFVITYSLRSIGDVGSVFRRYPGLWKVFVEEADMPGRYKLIAEQPSRPQGEALDYMIQQALDPNATTEGGEAAKPTLLGQLASTVKSLNAFMRALK